MRIDVLTLFPEMFGPVTEESILGRARENGILDIRLTDIREYSQDKHRKADDCPFGGGAGMVMLADPAFRALNAVGARGKRIIYMSPRGRILDQELVSELSREEEIVILCGHYEGVDQRIIDYWMERSERGHAPSRADVDPGELRELLPQIFILGLLLGYFRHRSGSTVLTVLLHGMVNAVAMIEAMFAVARG